MSRYKKFTREEMRFVETTELDLLEKDFTGYKCNVLFDPNAQQEVDYEFLVEKCYGEAIEDDDVEVTTRNPKVPTDTLMVSGHDSNGEFYQEVYETRFNPQTFSYNGFHLYELENTKTSDVLYEIHTPDDEHIIAVFYK